MRGPDKKESGLKQFMGEYHGYRTVETRVMLMLSFAVFVQLMFYNDSEETSVTYSALIFALLCVLVIVLGAWMDYFPSRLSAVQLRVVPGQGLSLGCLLLPTLATACLHRALLTQPPLASILFLYLILLTLMSVSTVMGTLLSLTPYPNSIVLYSVALTGLSYFTQAWIGTPMIISLPALTIYSTLVPCALTLFPKSFTLAEAVILAQTIVLMLTDVVLQVLRMGKLLQLPVLYHRSIPLLYVEFLLTGVCLCCLLLGPFLYKAHHSPSGSLAHKMCSTAFILLSLAIGLTTVLPWLQSLIGHHPIAFVFHCLSSSPTRLWLTGYWTLVSMATGVVVWAQSSTKGVWLKSGNPSGLWLRKYFHLSAVCVFVPGLLLDVDFLSFAASMTTFLFVVVELVRVVRVWPCGEALQEYLDPLCADRERGPLILSHLYLLLGHCVPLWISPHTGVGKLCVYSGVLSVGVGDAMAATAGSLFGRLKWPGTTKTVEGTLMSVLTQLLALVLIVLIDPDLPVLTQGQWLITSGGILLSAMLEAYTWQIDNLIVSLSLCSVYMAFLL